MSEWIKWNGGDCPVEENTKVEVELYNGQHFQYQTRPAKDFNWSSPIWAYSQVVAYRMVEQ